VLFEQTGAVFIEFRVGDDRDALGQRSGDLNSIFVQLLLGDEVGKVFDHEDDWVGVSGVDERV
jgi:hypothetical protein